MKKQKELSMYEEARAYALDFIKSDRCDEHARILRQSILIGRVARVEDDCSEILVKALAKQLIGTEPQKAFDSLFALIQTYAGIIGDECDHCIKLLESIQNRRGSKKT